MAFQIYAFLTLAEKTSTPPLTRRSGDGGIRRVVRDEELANVYDDEKSSEGNWNRSPWESIVVERGCGKSENCEGRNGGEWFYDDRLQTGVGPGGATTLGWARDGDGRWSPIDLGKISTACKTSKSSPPRSTIALLLNLCES